MPESRKYVRTNRVQWDRSAAEYERRHRRSLSGDRELAWGFWRLPEDSLRLLGDVRDRRVLELGCGAARWSAALARRGADVVGLDLSGARLAQARSVVQRARGTVRLVQGSAELLPFDDRAFDLVFCDWGGMTFADPQRTVPECSRVLDDDGVLAFSTSSPFRYVGLNPRTDRQERTFRRPYFGPRAFVFDGTKEFSLPYSEWVELFRANEFRIDRLVETRPPDGARSSYLSASDNRWSARWPTEILWRVTKSGTRRYRRRKRGRPSP